VIRLVPPRRAAIQRVSFPILVLLSIAAIVLGKADQAVFESIRMSVADAAAPTLDALSRPLVAAEDMAERAWGIVAAYQDNARLKAENERLLRWRRAALDLAAENARLRKLLKLAPEAAISYVTARVIANSGGAFARSLMVDAGSGSGVARGQAAITGDGLAGRVAEVGTRAARVLLVTDLNSRIPVILESSHQRAVLAGDNSERPLLRYLDPAAPVKIGDGVVTAGQGGVFPPGLPVGAVASVEDGVPRIEPYAELSRVEYLRIVDYGLADGLPAPVGPGPRGGRHARLLPSVASPAR
jgi:rod shape-determining protein MreC